MDFEAYVAARGHELLRFAYVLTRHRQTAEDVLQSALADAFRHWARVSAADHPDAYVRRMIVTTYLGSRRRRSAAEVPAGVPADVAESVGRPVRAQDPAEVVGGDDAFRVAIARLAPRARAVLVLRYYSDLDDAAIADILGVRRGTVSATASRALSELRDRMPQRRPSSAGGKGLE
jgi:RNA polymerase sigma-70 factor (sigma-E family)